MSAVVGLKTVPAGASDLFNAKHQITSTHTSELVIALCGPIGSPLHRVADAFKECLETDFGYDPCVVIRLSKLIEDHKGTGPVTPVFQRTKSLIEKGDSLRDGYGASILAELAVSEIVVERQKHKSASGSNLYEPRRICHIIDSIKNQEELDLLRYVYRDMMYFVGVFAPLPSRVKALEKSGMSLAEIYQLIDQDSGEEIPHGQTVRDTFPNADCFLRIDSDTDTQIKARVTRFLHLILGTKVITPTASETAMYFLIIQITHPVTMTRYGCGAVLAQA